MAGIVADEFGVHAVSVGGLGHHFATAIDDVTIGQGVAVGRDEIAGTGSARWFDHRW